MGKKNSRTSRVSNGGRNAANIRHEEKRQAKFAAKKGTDKEYKYTPNPYEKDTKEYYIEKKKREEKVRKTKDSKPSFIQFRSIMAKLTNELNKQKELEKNKKKHNSNKEMEN